MKKNVFSACASCFYAEYLGLGEVGCYDDKPPCIRNWFAGNAKKVSDYRFSDNENKNPNDIAYNNIQKEDV